MTTQQLVTSVKERTRHQDDTRVVRELNSSLDWAYTKVFNSTNGPDLLMTFDTELTMAAVTRDYDLGANVTGTLYSIKQLWLRFATDTNFTPMIQRDAVSDDQFVWADQYPSSDTTSIAVGHPVRYDIINFAKVRFAPMLPTGAIIRIDACIKPPDMDPTTNPTLTYSFDIPEPTHQAIADKATGQIFRLLDDTRAKEYDSDIRPYGSAQVRLTDAMYLMTRRAQGPTITKPFRRQLPRWI